MKISVTLHLWWLLAYLATGVLLYLPLEWMAWRSIGSRPRERFWPWLRWIISQAWYGPFVIAALWPLAVWEQVR